MKTLVPQTRSLADWREALFNELGVLTRKEFDEYESRGVLKPFMNEHQARAELSDLGWTFIC